MVEDAKYGPDATDEAGRDPGHFPGCGGFRPTQLEREVTPNAAPQTEMPSSEILCVGEVLWDALPEGLFLGGAPFNVACHLRAAGVPASPGYSRPVRPPE